MNNLTDELKESFLERYRGRLSFEWMFPKSLRMVRKAPQVYEKADRINQITRFMRKYILNIKNYMTHLALGNLTR